MITVIIGLNILRSIWKNKEKYIKENKRTTYQRAFKKFTIGLPFLFSVIAHIFIPIRSFFLITPINNFTIILSTSIFAFSPFTSLIGFYIQEILSLFYLILGLLIVRKSLQVFGIDYMTLVYLFYPNESKIQNHRIYSILHHPTYTGAICITLGGLFINFSIYSIIQFFMIFLGLNCHIRFVEEPELIERFGKSYIEYRKNVPAFLIRFRDIPELFKFIIGKR